MGFFCWKMLKLLSLQWKTQQVVWLLLLRYKKALTLSSLTAGDLPQGSGRKKRHVSAREYVSRKSPVSKAGLWVDVPFGSLRSLDPDLTNGSFLMEDLETWKNPKVVFSSHRIIVIFLQQCNLPRLLLLQWLFAHWHEPSDWSTEWWWYNLRTQRSAWFLGGVRHLFRFLLKETEVTLVMSSFSSSHLLPWLHAGFLQHWLLSSFQVERKTCMLDCLSLGAKATVVVL